MTDAAISPRAWIQVVARAGYFARGTVYAIVSFFAILASLGAGSSKGAEGALASLLSKPFGTFLVALLIAGLCAYVVWRTVQALLDADHHGVSLKGLAIRAALLTSAVSYGTLAIYALGLLGVPVKGDGRVTFDGLNALVRLAGPHLVATALSAVFLGIALAHWWKVLDGKYSRHFDKTECPMRTLHLVSVLGLGARGVVFALLALMLWLGIEKAPSSTSDIPSTQDALRYLQQLRFGQGLLFTLAVGLLVFAAYSFFEARWRRVGLD